MAEKRKPKGEEMEKLIVLAVVIAAVLAVVAVAFAKKPAKGDAPKKRRLLTEREQAMHNRLTQALPNAVILAQVSMGALLTARSRATRNRFDRKIVDFVVCDRAFQVVAVIELDDKLRPLFAADQFTQVEWAVRHKLDGKPLAQWLHGFYASHAAPFPLKIETLHRLCGSEAGEMWKFAQTLRKALDDVAEASAAHGEGFSYEIRGDLVHVEKKAQGAQRRHLAKKAAKPRKPRG